ncbi:MAG: M4 family metallopeptidase [Bacteroidetes bacterium]|nr:M4 family metallopeptidase [Bacteroidota bacterium]
MEKNRNKITRLLMAWGLSILACNLALGQNARQQRLEQIAKPVETKGWYDFKEEIDLPYHELFTIEKSTFGLSAHDEMRMTKNKTDEMGFNHYYYQQFAHGIKVTGAEMIVHVNPTGKTQSANGKIVEGLAMATPQLTIDAARTKAMEQVSSTNYVWLNPEREAKLRDKTKNPLATNYPAGELVYARIRNTDAFNAQNYKLCYVFDIKVEELGLSKRIFINALDGSVHNEIPLDIECNAGTGTSAYNGAVSFNSDLVNGSYRMVDDCQSTVITVYNRNAATTNATATHYTDANNDWTATSQRSAVQCMYGGRRSFLYYLNVHSRTSFDNAGGDITTYNNAGFVNSQGNTYGTNAFASSDGNLYFGYGNSASSTTDDWNSLDIFGHELTHFVTGNESGLVYQDESGALNESLSDIFGEMVESNALGINDYLIGTDIGYIRNMSNPNDKNDPDTYLGTNWYVGSNDNGGVHTNSGVNNYAFYLAAEGGSGTNDNGAAFNVVAISRFDARDIWYRAATLYLGSNDAHIDMRAATLRAAFDLYGQCSQEIISVGEAWRAVGVGSQSAQYVNDVCGVYPFSGTYKQAINHLRVANGCAVSVTVGNTVYFSARDRVTIYPGFNAVSGSKFYAYLEPCAVTMWRKPATVTDVRSSDLLVFESTETDEPSLHVSPNPFSQSFAVNAPVTTGELTITIYDAEGRTVYTFNKMIEQDDLSYSKQIDGSAFDKGIYFVEIRNGENQLKQKLVKTN